VDWLLIGVVTAGLLLLLLTDFLYMLSFNKKLRVMAREAASASKAKTDFLSTMSHDIRTPMNAIIGLTTIAEVAGSLGLPEGALLKAYPVMVEGRGLVLVVLRGDHQVNDIKLTNALGADFRPAQESDFAERIGPAGYIGPVGIDVPILMDQALDGDS
jgi:signal transduction histidine kinase